MGKNKMEIHITPLLKKDISMLNECWCSLIKRENDCLTRNFPVSLVPQCWPRVLKVTSFNGHTSAIGFPLLPYYSNKLF